MQQHEQPPQQQLPSRRRCMGPRAAAVCALLGATASLGGIIPQPQGAQAFLMPPSSSSSSMAARPSVWQHQRQQQRQHFTAWAAAAAGGASSEATTTTETTTPIDLTAASAAPASSSSSSAAAAAAAGAGAAAYGLGGSGSPSALATSLDPIGRIDANPQALLEWVKAGRGVKHDAVGLTNLIGEEGLPTGAGDNELARWTLQATQDVAAGTVLVSIPNVLTLSPTRRKYKLPTAAAAGATGGVQLQEVLRALGAKDEVNKLLEAAVIDEKIQKVMDSFPDSYWRIKLAVLLVAERMKGPQSFWWPYLRNLPEKYAYMPIFYNNSEFGSIQIPSLMRTVQSRCRMLVNISDGYLRQLSGNPDNPFLDDVHANDMGWGLCAASSRALRHIPGLNSPVMVPLIDLCQHAVEPSCHVKDYRTSGGAIQLVASRDIKAGELLTLSYGNLTNAELLLDYGFTIQDNPHDRFDFTLSDDLVRASQKLMAFETEPFGDRRVPGLIQPWQEKVLDALDLAPKVNGTPYWPPVKMSFGGPNRIDGRLLALLRTMYCRDRRLFALSNVTYAALQAYDTKFRISTFERRAIMHALGIAATLLRRLPTMLTEDWRLLTGESLYIGHDEDSRTVVFRSLPDTDESRDELLETVTTDESVVKEYNPYREAELMERREPVIQYMGGSMNRCMREILRFRIGQKKILYQVISDICHTMYGHGLVQSVNDMEELEEERAVMANPEETSRPLAAARGGQGARSLDSILEWAEKTFGDDAGL